MSISSGLSLMIPPDLKNDIFLIMIIIIKLLKLLSKSNIINI